MSDKDIEIQSVDKWMNPQYDDMFISRIELANNIEKYIGDINGEDCVVAPFSELARFYDNIEHKEFDALITKLKSIQSTNIAFDKHQRIYIVIVGQYSKISNFENDPQMFAWYLKSDDKQFNYRLVLSNGTDYDVRNLKNRYTVVNNLKEWLYLWRNGIDIANTIISTSPSIYAYEQNALPDNAFDFDKCENVYKFLTLGLKLSFGNVQYKECDDAYWRELAEKIDVTNFVFSKFLKQYFHLFELKDYRDFIKAWHSTDDSFDKWLLVTYYLSEFDKSDYLFSALQNCCTYTDRELFEQLMLAVFDFEDMSAQSSIRLDVLRIFKYKGALSKEAQETLEERLIKVATDYGFKTAANLLTPFTSVEKKLLSSGMEKVIWLYAICEKTFLYSIATCKIMCCRLIHKIGLRIILKNIRKQSFLISTIRVLVMRCLSIVPMMLHSIHGIKILERCVLFLLIETI